MWGSRARVQTMLPVRSFEEIEGESILLATRKGVIKKTPLTAYSNPRRSGIIAINLGDDDELIGVGRCRSQNEVILASKNGKSIRFDEGQVRAMGRSGVRSSFPHPMRARPSSSSTMRSKGSRTRSRRPFYLRACAGGSKPRSARPTKPTSRTNGIASTRATSAAGTS